MPMPSPEELTSLMSQLNYEVMKAQSEVTVLRSALSGYLASKGERENALDEIIAKGAAILLNVRLEQAEKISPGGAAQSDKRTAEEVDLVCFDVLEELRSRREG